MKRVLEGSGSPRKHLQLNNEQSVEEMFRDKNLTFEDITMMKPKQFKQGPGGFRVSDILERLSEPDDDDEILRQFKVAESHAKVNKKSTIPS